MFIITVKTPMYLSIVNLIPMVNSFITPFRILLSVFRSKPFEIINGSPSVL